MKNKLPFLIILIMTLSCAKSKDYYITINNNSNKTILVERGLAYPRDSLGVLKVLYSDIIDPPQPIKPHSSQKRSGPGYKLSSWYIDFFDAKTEFYGYVSIYIMDAAVKVRYDLETIQKDYMILARYDLTQDDIERLDWEISYPPTPEMSKVHMYPPYNEVVSAME